MSIINPLVFQQKRKNYIPRIFLSCWLAVLTSCCFAFASVDDVIRTFLGTIITAFAKIVLSICDLVINPLFSITTMKTSDIAKYIPGFDISGEGLGNFFSVTIGYVSMAMATVIVVCTILQYIIQLMHGEKVDSLTRIVWDICIGVILTVVGQRLLILIFDNIVAELSSAFADGAMSYSSADLNFLEASDVALSGFSSGTMVSVGESVNGVATLILCVILLCVIGWNFITLVLECAERYVVCVFLILLSPLVFSTAVSGKTKATAKNWLEMYFSHCVLLILNIWVVGIARTALDNNVIGATYTELIVWALVTYAFLKMAQKVDDMMKAAGLHVTSTGSDPLKDMIGAFGAVKGAIGATVGAIGGTIGMASGANSIAGAVKNGASIQDALKNDTTFSNLAPKSVQKWTKSGAYEVDKGANLAAQRKAERKLDGTPVENLSNSDLGEKGVKETIQERIQEVNPNAKAGQIANLSKVGPAAIRADHTVQDANGQVDKATGYLLKNQNGKLGVVAQQYGFNRIDDKTSVLQTAAGKFRITDKGTDKYGNPMVGVQQLTDAQGNAVNPANAPEKLMKVDKRDTANLGVGYAAAKAGMENGNITKMAEENAANLRNAQAVSSMLEQKPEDRNQDFDGKSLGATNAATENLMQNDDYAKKIEDGAKVEDVTKDDDGNLYANLVQRDENGNIISTHLAQLDGENSKDVKSFEMQEDGSAIMRIGDKSYLATPDGRPDDHDRQKWNVQELDKNGDPIGETASTTVGAIDVKNGNAAFAAMDALDKTGKLEAVSAQNERDAQEYDSAARIFSGEQKLDSKTPVQDYNNEGSYRAATDTLNSIGALREGEKITGIERGADGRAIAVAKQYDADGNVTGVRRFDMKGTDSKVTSEASLQSDGSLLAKTPDGHAYRAERVTDASGRNAWNFRQVDGQGNLVEGGNSVSANVFGKDLDDAGGAFKALDKVTQNRDLEHLSRQNETFAQNRAAATESWENGDFDKLGDIAKQSPAATNSAVGVGLVGQGLMNEGESVNKVMASAGNDSAYAFVGSQNNSASKVVQLDANGQAETVGTFDAGGNKTPATFTNDTGTFELIPEGKAEFGKQNVRITQTHGADGRELPEYARTSKDYSVRAGDNAVTAALGEALSEDATSNLNTASVQKQEDYANVSELMNATDEQRVKMREGEFFGTDLHSEAGLAAITDYFAENAEDSVREKIQNGSKAVRAVIADDGVVETVFKNPDTGESFEAICKTSEGVPPAVNMGNTSSVSAPVAASSTQETGTNAGESNSGTMPPPAENTSAPSSVNAGLVTSFVPEYRMDYKNGKPYANSASVKCTYGDFEVIRTDTNEFPDKRGCAHWKFKSDAESGQGIVEFYTPGYVKVQDVVGAFQRGLNDENTPRDLAVQIAKELDNNPNQWRKFTVEGSGQSGEGSHRVGRTPSGRKRGNKGDSKPSKRDEVLARALRRTPSSQDANDQGSSKRRKK